MAHKIITVAQQKGGAGKTTVAAHLAVAFMQKGNKVAVIDIDPQGSLTDWHNVRQSRFGEGFTGLSFCTVSGWRVGAEIDRFKNFCDIIIIDTPPHSESSDAKTAIRAANLIITPMQPSPTDLWATKGTVELTSKEGIPAFILLNRMPPHGTLARTIAQEISSRLSQTLGNRVAFMTSIMEGMCCTETEPTSIAAEEVRNLVREISGILEKQKTEARNFSYA